MKYIIKNSVAFLAVIIVLAGVIIFALKPSEPQVLKIGVIAPLTGPAADYGEEIKNGVLSSSYAGVEFIFEDDKCDPKEAVSAFKKLVEFEKVQYVIGPACGSPQEAIVPLLKNKSVVAIVPSAASSALYEMSGGNFYNMQYSLEDESKYVAEKMFEKGYTQVALVSYQNAFSKTHADSFRKHFKGTILVDSVFVDPSTDVSTEVAKIKASKSQAIYSPDISFFFAGGMTKLKQFKVSVPVFSTYVTELPVARTLVPEVFYSFPADVTDEQGAVFSLSKQSAVILSAAVLKCSGKTSCVKDELDSSGKFGIDGVFKRDLVLKQIKGGKAELLK
jgi:branched-chain amino acid transport system substrate-binding protein